MSRIATNYDKAWKDLQKSSKKGETMANSVQKLKTSEEHRKYSVRTTVMLSEMNIATK
jgi:hypothetical protein